jgi:hypothetical protein
MLIERRADVANPEQVWTDLITSSVFSSTREGRPQAYCQVIERNADVTAQEKDMDSIISTSGITIGTVRPEPRGGLVKVIRVRVLLQHVRTLLPRLHSWV